jgi:hypothetical protein
MLYAAGMTRGPSGASLVVAAALAVPGCFRGGFLDDTCEQRGGCDDSTTGAADTTGAATTPPPTSTGTSSDTSTGEPLDTTGGAPGVLLAGPAFRVSALEIVDPPLFTSVFGSCTDASSFINGTLMASVENYDTNLILVAKDYDPARATQDFLFYRSASCPPGDGYCVINPALLPTTFVAVNQDVGSCGYVDMMTVNPTNYGFLHQPMAPCVVSPTASIEFQLGKELPEIEFLLGKFAAEYRPTAEAPERLERATLQGFIPEANAMEINYTYLDMPVNLWSVIRGSDHPDACPIPPDGMPGSVSDVDMVDVDGPEGPDAPIRGVFLYMNFTAKKIDVYAPL